MSLKEEVSLLKRRVDNCVEEQILAIKKLYKQNVEFEKIAKKIDTMARDYFLKAQSALRNKNDKQVPIFEKTLRTVC